MHSLSITPGLKNTVLLWKWAFSFFIFFVHQGRTNIKTVCIELQTGGTAR